MIQMQMNVRSPAHAVLRAAVAAALVAAVPMSAQAAGDRTGYLTTGDGRPVADASGECWHTGEWTHGMSYQRCDARPARAVHAVPSPVARTPAPQPQVAARPTSFRLALDELFDFDRAVLRPQGRALLDKLADQIDRASYSSIVVVGHADRVGSASYNQALSVRRAQAVRNYLAARGLDAGTIVAQGVGSSEPVTARERCSGMRGAALIACFQPDRYAELKISGTAPTAAIGSAITSLQSVKSASVS